MLHKAIAAIVLSSICTASFAQELKFSPQETGFPSLTYSVTEVSHSDSVSDLKIPGFEDRSAVASRWMMCVYTNVAIIRHKNYLVTAYPEGDDIVHVGFPESKDAGQLEKLGPPFAGNDKSKQVMLVATMREFCSRMGYKFAYLPAEGLMK
jgi:hypothetical protein